MSPPSPPDAREGGSSEELGPSLLFLLSAVVISQVGLEALRLALPQMVKATLGKFTYMAQLHLCMAVAGVAGRLLGGVLPERFGLKPVYLSSKVFKTALVAALAGLLAGGHMTLAVITAYYLLNGFSVGITRTTLQSIPPAVAAQRRPLLEKYWAWQRVGLNVVQIGGPLLAAALIASHGFLPAFLLLPAAFLIAIALVAFGTKVPEAHGPGDDPEGGDKDLRALLRDSLSGGPVVLRDPVLRPACLSLVVVAALTPALYFVIAPAYGLLAAGGSVAAGAGVHARITGLFSAGGLLGALIMLAGNRRLERERRAGRMSEDEHRRAMNASTLSWMRWAALSQAAFLAMLVPVLTGVRTLAPVYAAMFLFGVPHSVTMLKLRSLFQARIPERRDIPKVMGFMSSVAVLAAAGVLYALGWAFDNLPGSTAVICLNCGMAAAACALLLLVRSLEARLT